MSVALSAGVTGLQANQKMLDVAGNNLSNINTTGYKASRINFSELLSQTIVNASAPTANIGGTNPEQMGSGVGVGSITRDTTQGDIVNTNNPLDVAIEGGGYFVMSDGSKNVYTRVGTLGVDQNSNLVDVTTGYRVQRVGSAGEPDFQTPGDSSILIPYDTTMQAKATSSVKLAGNLSADESLATVQTQVITSDVSYTTSDGSDALAATKLTDLSQYTSGSLTGATITVTGYTHAGTAVTDTTGLSITSSTTMTDLLDYIETKLGGSSAATVALVNGQIQVTDAQSGYRLTDVQLKFNPATGSGAASLTMPGYFQMTTVGGEEVKDINIPVYDAQGRKHILTGALVRTDTSNTWDFVMTSITGNIHNIDPDARRIKGLTFSADDGAYAGITGTDKPELKVSFAHNPDADPQTITLDFGTAGKFSGLAQVAGASTAVATDQDGYEAGKLSTVSISNEGTVVGTFSNGVRRDIASLQLALFKNAAGMESVGKGYYVPTVNSGDATATVAQTGGAGTIHGGALEKSNADVATEFVSLIEAQNGYQANSRTITVANQILQTLTNLIR